MFNVSLNICLGIAYSQQSMKVAFITFCAAKYGLLCQSAHLLVLVLSKRINYPSYKSLGS